MKPIWFIVPGRWLRRRCCRVHRCRHHPGAGCRPRSPRRHRSGPCCWAGCWRGNREGDINLIGKHVRIRGMLGYIQTYFSNSHRLGGAQVQGYSYDQRLENVDNDFNVPHTPIVGLLHCRYNNNNIHIMMWAKIVMKKLITLEPACKVHGCKVFSDVRSISGWSQSYKSYSS